MCQSFDCSHPNIPWGEAHLFKSMPINPDLWLCVGVSNGTLDPNEWYYSQADDKWFGLGLPVAVWKDAIVLLSTVPDHLLVILDLIFGKPIPLQFHVRWVLMAPWLPSIHEMVTSSYADSSVLSSFPGCNPSLPLSSSRKETCWSECWFYDFSLCCSLWSLYLSPILSLPFSLNVFLFLFLFLKIPFTLLCFPQNLQLSSSCFFLHIPSCVLFCDFNLVTAWVSIIFSLGH